MIKFTVSTLMALSLFLVSHGCNSKPIEDPLSSSDQPGMAFLYQYVGNMKNGVGGVSGDVATSKVYNTPR